MSHKKFLISSLLAGSLLVSQSVAHAEDDTNSDNDDNNGQIEHKVFVQGSDLSESQIDETKDELDVSNGYKTYTVDKDDVAKYTGGTYDFIHSSASIVPKKFQKGVDVEIKTPDNITRITKEQYTNAAITSGVQNAHIQIASVDSVTGEGALAGIHKAYEAEGNDLNQEDINNANQEMNDLAQINDENKDNDDYSDDAMNNAVADMKEQVADEKQSGNDVSDEDINKIVNKTLKAKGLDNSLNDNQISKVNNIVLNAADSNAMKHDPKAYAQQASKLKDNLSGSVDKLKDKANENKGFFASIWQAIVDFFEAIANFFKNLL